MTARSKTHRVRWRVRAGPKGWVPTVEIGPVPIVLRPCATKRDARNAAKAKAKQVKGEL